MTEVPTAERSVESQPPVSAPATTQRPKSQWPWIVLLLWALWLAAMIVLSFPELGHKRISHDIPPRIDQYLNNQP